MTDPSSAAPLSTVLLAGAGFVAGLVDAIGGGGGLVSLPALLAVGLPPPIALATNKGQAIFGAVASFASFWRRGGIDRARAPIGFVAGLVGSCLGVRALLAMRPEPLRPVVMVLLIVAAVVVLAGRARAPGAPGRPRVDPAGRSGLVALAAIALVLGTYDGFFGPGTGSMLIVALTLVFGQTLTRASGNAKVINLASNLAAFVLFARHGTIVWSVALPMAAANAAGAALGAHLAVKRGDRLVRWVVLAVVTSVVIKLGVDMARAG
jgi:hypothetical protein